MDDGPHVAAIPFLQNTISGDAFRATVLFGGLALAEKSFPALREPRLAVVR